jgi:UDP-glucose 4-epimerase
MMFCIVTGGAGFIGSHIVDTLIAGGDDVLVIDDCSTGTIENLAGHCANERVTIINKNLLDDGWQQYLKGADRVYHIAADPDVRTSSVTPDSQIRNNVIATHRVLEVMRAHSVPELVFTSTSTVYGEATVIPTPETYAPLEPISVYGATKLACEAMISAYCHSFKMQAWIYRFANIIGERSNHGVIWDFIQKLRADPQQLEILGDGRQTKSYLEVEECVRAVQYGVDYAHEAVNTFNIGSEDWIDVVRIADIVAAEMGLSTVRYRFTGGARGWVGDVPRMQLAVEKLKSLGWKPSTNSEESVHTAVRAMLR